MVPFNEVLSEYSLNKIFASDFYVSSYLSFQRLQFFLTLEKTRGFFGRTKKKRHNSAVDDYILKQFDHKYSFVRIVYSV